MSDKPKFTRRDFLRLATVGTAVVASRHIPLVNTFIWGDQFPRGFEKVPPELENLKIPENNPNLKTPMEIVNSAIDMYTEWRKQDPSLPEAYYKKPDGYISRGVLVDDYIKNTQETIEEIKIEIQKTGKFPDWAVASLLDAPENQEFENGRHHLSYAANSVNYGEPYATWFLYMDPGSGIGDRIKQKLKLNMQKNMPSANNFDKSLEQNIASLYKEEFLLELNYLKQYSDTKIGLSEPLGYSLWKNKGDIVKALWDWAIFLRIYSRHNIENMQYNPQTNAIREMMDMFRDEISIKIPFDWLNNNLPKDGYLWDPSSSNYQEYKNFNPPNRIGELYRAADIIAESACSTPEIEWMMNKVYSAYGDVGGSDTRGPHGSVKLKSLEKVAGYTFALSKLWEKHEKF